MDEYVVVCIHGISGSPHWNFFPVLSKLLKKHHVDFVMPQMPGHFLNAFPLADEWVEKIHDVVGEIDKPIIFVGFSLGCCAILLYLEKYQKKVEHVIFISSPGNYQAAQPIKQKRSKTFFQHVVDLKKIRHLSKIWTVIHSYDDPKVDFRYGKYLAENLHAEFILVDGYGHFDKRQYGTYVFKLLQDRLSLT